MDDFAYKHPMFALLIGGPRAFAGGTDSASLEMKILRDSRRDVERYARYVSITDQIDHCK